MGEWVGVQETIWYYFHFEIELHNSALWPEKIKGIFLKYLQPGFNRVWVIIYDNSSMLK